MGAADLAGVGLAELQAALAERRIAICDDETLDRESAALDGLFGG